MRRILFASLAAVATAIASIASLAALPPPPGGPLLLITDATRPFSGYYAEILRTEGINAFATVDVAALSAAALSGIDVAVLADTSLAPAQVDTLTTWVNGGGRLIAMRPDKQLAPLLGLGDANSTLADGYVSINTTSAAGRGLVPDTIQFHGSADLYTNLTASVVATLYAGASAATASPAVTTRPVGASGGIASAFAFDLARSTVYTRQGNPAWGGTERDGLPPIRPDDLFFGAAAGDVKPDWSDLSKVAIPQADELQRLFANLIEVLAADRRPLPRFWYFPNGHKAVVVMTGDDHGRGGTVGRFNNYKSLSTPGCSVSNWECIRATSYVYGGAITNVQAVAFDADGFEIALHVTTQCANWTRSSFDSLVSGQLANWRSRFPGLASPTTNRTHCLSWSDYDSEPQVEFTYGMRLDTTYYYWPPGWVLDRPGFFTGSGLPMRYARADGTVIDVYQAVTQMTDESSQSYPFTIDTLLDRAVGPLGYYGAFTANMHTDDPASLGSDAIVASAKAHGVPVVSSRQMLKWLDAKGASSFGALSWDAAAHSLAFTLAADPAAVGLQALVPASGGGGALLGLTRGGVAVPYTVQSIKGQSYAVVTAIAGSYVATYAAAPATPPDTAITSAPPTPTNSTSASFAFTSTQSGSTFTCGVDAGAMVACTSPAALTAVSGGSHTFSVAARGPSGLTDPTAAVAAWTVDLTAPTVTLTAPEAGATLSGVVTVTANASDSNGVAGVQFRLDGTALGAEDLTAPYSTAWNTSSVANGTHAVTAIARDAAGNVRTSTAITVTVANAVPDTTPPAVSVTAPAPGTVSGDVAVTAAASDNVGVAGVQFRLDGAALGAEDVVAPFSVVWSTTPANNGSHVLTAVARDAAGNATTSASIAVTVSNAAPPPPPPGAGLVAAFGFSEAAGATTADGSGNANTGTLNGATRVAGQAGHGNALSFNGTSNTVSVANSASLRFTAAVTIEAWVNPATLAGARSVVLKQNPNSGLAWALYGVDAGPGPAGEMRMGGVNRAVNGPAALPLNTWTHIATTYDGTNLAVYVNGVQVATTAATGAFDTTFTTMWIGGNQPFGEYFSGLIDDVRIYNRALAPGEIAADMAAPVS